VYKFQFFPFFLTKGRPALSIAKERVCLFVYDMDGALPQQEKHASQRRMPKEACFALFALLVQEEKELVVITVRAHE
jgi:hypothetical protein